MIRDLSSREIQEIFEIINKSAVAYQGHIPGDCYHEPYMPLKELRHEMRSMTFFGWWPGDKLLGVMGFQPVKDVTLLRHAYVLPGYQRSGIGQVLLNHLKQITQSRYLLVGTWADATWAVAFYQKHGFKFMPDKDELLIRYWNVPQRQRETSVVLGIEINHS